MKKGTTLFLKAAVFFIGIVVFILCVLIANTLIRHDVGGYRPILIGMLMAAIPFFVGVYYTLKLLTNIDKKKAFTGSSINALNGIKYCGVIIGVLYGLGMPYIFNIANRDDAPGVALLGFIFTFSPLAISVFAAVIQKLFKDAIDLKLENDLTV